MMRSKVVWAATAALVAAGLGSRAAAQRGATAPGPDERVTALVARLDLTRYKATIKGLTQFGDRRQGTDRNRAAVDWIETQLKSYGCATERLKYVYTTPPPTPNQQQAAHARGATSGSNVRPTPVTSAGGGRPRGITTRTSVNTDPNRQPDARLRALNAQPAADGPREEVYCTKVGSTRPDEMYIIGAHMDGHGWGETANDDGSGTALVMELARVFSSPDVQTERSIRFALWNNEETGLNGSRAYVEQRQTLQGQENPPGSGRYPE